MRIAIHQPQFMPWLGYLEKIDKADLFVFLDTVQFKKNEYQNRNRIRTAKGWQWLTVPVQFSFGDPICKVNINETISWRKKHLASLRLNYSKAPFFKTFFPLFEELYASEEGKEEFSNLCSKSVLLLKEAFGIKTEVTTARNIKGLRNDPDGRLIDICHHFGATEYLSGAGGKGYLNQKQFHQERVQLLFQHFVHPQYKQCYDGFEPFMAAVDYLFMQGGDFSSVREANCKIEKI